MCDGGSASSDATSGTDATVHIGETTQGTPGAGYSYGLMEGMQVTVPSNASSPVIQSISLYIDSDTPSPAGTFRMGIYTDASGFPGTLVAQTGDLTPVLGTFNTATVSPQAALTAGASYWIFYSGSSNNLHVPSVTGSGLRTGFTYTGGSQTLPSPFPNNALTSSATWAPEHLRHDSGG